MSIPLGKNNKVPTASRARSAGWRDPRLWVGVAIVAASVLLGVRVFAAADNSVEVWSLAQDMGEGEQVSAADVHPVKVRFVDEEDAERYLAASEPLPDELTLKHAVGSGELLPRAAVSTDGADLQRVVLEVSDISATGIARGQKVTVWLSPDENVDTKDAKARKLIDDALVLELTRPSSSFGSDGSRAMVIGVPAEDSDAVAELMSASHLPERLSFVGTQ